jgi:hypothetical protein
MPSADLIPESDEVVKFPGEIRDYPIPFDERRFPELAADDEVTTLVSVVATPTTYPALVITQPALWRAFGGDRGRTWIAMARFAGGLDGTVYVVTFTVQTASGRVLQNVGRLRVSQPRAA